MLGKHKIYTLWLLFSLIFKGKLGMRRNAFSV